MDISNIFLLYDGDGSPESPFLVPVVGFVGALVGGIKQLQMRNNNIIKDEVVQKLNKPDSNYADVMVIVTKQPCTIIKFHSSQ